MNVGRICVICVEIRAICGFARNGLARVGAYDPAYPLVLDPVILVYCGFIGGSGTEIGSGIAVDAAGNAYVAGRTITSDGSFPSVVGPDLSFGGAMDAFVARVSPDGASLAYCGFIGGLEGDEGHAIAIDSGGNAYVTGYTQSYQDTFPVTVGPGLTHGGGTDAFVAKVNADGAALGYCGYIGGLLSDEGYGIAVDTAGNAYVTGLAYSSETTFPAIIGPDLTSNGDVDAFVAKVSTNGASLLYCGFIGGAESDEAYGIAVDTAGNTYVTGITDSTEATFPAIGGPDLTSNGGYDAFAAKLSSSGASLAYCGFIGGSANEAGYGIAVDPAGSAYVVGGTRSSEATFPVTGGPDLTGNGDLDAFVAKIASTVGGPRIDRINIRTATPGSKAQILGAGFSTSRRGNTVVFGTRTARVTRATATKLTVKIPSQLRSGQTVTVYVKVNGNVSNSKTFQVR
ncbi:MAG: SBBP repeat-containing protein [Acidobacteria bacterium]|nr:SBBP repeat-containing protein [Acidobacteriota bacterium]